MTNTPKKGSAPPDAKARPSNTHNKTTEKVLHKNNVKTTFDVGDKFDFIAAVAAMPANRNKRRPLLNATDLAVLTIIVQRCNPKIGYAWCSARRISDEIDASHTTINRSILKLMDRELIVEVGEPKSGSQRKALRPAWERLIRPIILANQTSSGAEYSLKIVDTAIDRSTVETAMPVPPLDTAIDRSTVETAMPVPLKGSERNVNEVNGISGAFASASAKASRRSRASGSGKPDPAKPNSTNIMKLINQGSV